MELPKKLLNSPLTQSIVEISVSPKCRPDEILSVFYPMISTDFPSSTSEIMSDGTSLWQFRNERFAVRISSTSIGFEALEYSEWSEFINVMSNAFDKFKPKLDFASIKRIGVRYINIVEGQHDLSKIIKSNALFNLSGFDSSLQNYIQTLQSKDLLLFLQIASVANAVNKIKKITKTGAYIDIDCSCTTNLTENTVIPVIETAHTKIKELFFSIITEEFKTQCAPSYE